MNDQSAKDMRKALGLDRMLWMPDPTKLGYEQDNAEIRGSEK